ncbi:integrase/recombinase XerD [Methanococcus maripaludis]|uniref:Integrase/recombinase XerD n=1 Tax=Methanococcus maripaludis TaxID=39152 RepID=A0A7J9P614_METMI|nr:tyrosine-type recombinase/integrase [Methanococcus maripaludis]MBA2858641.1 integrase/recombinase XerD [Methanococcus maripaludis]
MDIEKLISIKPKRDEVKETPQIREWLDRFREEREFDGIKKTTLRNDITRLRVFLSFVFIEIEKTPEITNNGDFVKFFNYLEKERKLQRNTLDKYFKLLKVFYRLMRLKNFSQFEEESKERKRYSKFEIKHYDSINADLINQVLQKIIKSSSRTKLRDAVHIRFLWDTGARLSESLNITYGDCDFNEGLFKLRDTKGSEERMVTCSSDTLEALKHYCRFNVRQGPEDTIFQTNKGGRIVKVGWIGQVFKSTIDELKQEGKIPKNKRIVVHSLRHGRAVDLLDQGIPIEIVKEYLGHKSIETTLFYAHSKERQQKMIKDIKKML